MFRLVDEFIKETLTLFLATAVSFSPWALAPAWPNWTWRTKRKDNRQRSPIICDKFLFTLALKIWWAFFSCQKITQDDWVWVNAGIEPSLLTSDVNIPAHVPIHQTTTGLVTSPLFMASQILYSSVPPTWYQKKHPNWVKWIFMVATLHFNANREYTSPRTTIILTSGFSWYLITWSMNVVPGYLSPPMATPSYTPSVVREMMLLSSLDMPPDRDT